MIKDAVVKLLSIVEDLKKTYPQKEFTLDGRLVGDIGEVLVEETYLVKLNSGLSKHHDAICLDITKRNVQIKATMKHSLTFPCDHIPDYYLGVKISNDGKIEEIYNGPGILIKKKLLMNRKPTKTNLHSISIQSLKRLNCEILPKDRIPKRIN